MSDTQNNYSDKTEMSEHDKPSVAVRTAPPRIWLQISDDSYDHDEPFPTDHNNITWCQDSVVACEGEYVRADLALAALTAERERWQKWMCRNEWSNVNDPPCHPGDKDWSPCDLCCGPELSETGK